MTTAKLARVVSVTGNPRPGSRTSQAASSIAAALHTELGFEPGGHVHIDLADAANPLAPDAKAQLASELEAVTTAQVLVIATPTYKASYTGLLKAFLDLLPPAALAGSAAVPLLTLAAPQHALAADVHLRPLLLELGARTPTAAVTLLDSDLADLATTVEERARELAASLGPAQRLVSA